MAAGNWPPGPPPCDTGALPLMHVAATAAPSRRLRRERAREAQGWVGDLRVQAVTDLRDEPLLPFLALLLCLCEGHCSQQATTRGAAAQAQCKPSAPPYMRAWAAWACLQVWGFTCLRGCACSLAWRSTGLVWVGRRLLVGVAQQRESVVDLDGRAGGLGARLCSDYCKTMVVWCSAPTGHWLSRPRALRGRRQGGLKNPVTSLRVLRPSEGRDSLPGCLDMAPCREGEEGGDMRQRV